MRRTTLLTSAAPLIVLMMSAGGAVGQTVAGVSSASAAPSSQTTEVETITVTAEKRAENIQEVPLSIRAVTGEALVNAGVRDTVDLQKLVPSLDVSPGLFGAGVVIRIRGFGSAGNTAIDPDVASYLDGAYVPRSGAILSSFLDIKSVEVLSGPQGTLFGRNAALGAISINSNDPSTSRRTLDLKFEGGSYGTYGGTAVVNLPISDTFAIRGAITGSHTDGLYNNYLDGRTYGAGDTIVGRLSAKWNITPKLTWIVRADGSRVDGDGAFPQAVYTGTAPPGTLSTLAAFNTQFGGSQQVYSNNPSYNFNQYFGNPYITDRQYGIISDLNYNLSPVLTVRLIDSYRNWTDRQQSPDTISTSLDLLSIGEPISSNSQSHEIQLISSKGAFFNGHLGFTSGLYYFHENYRQGALVNLGSQFCNAIFTTVGAPFLTAPCQAAPLTDASTSDFEQAVDSYAAYVQANVLLLPRLELDAGVRETYDRKNAVYTSTVANALAVGAIVQAEGPEALHFTDHRPSFRASLSYHATDRILLFGTFSTGYKSGGFDSGPSSPALTPALRTFASETVTDFEAGIKSVFWDNRVLINATLFNTNLKNFQDRSFNGTSFLIRNAGNVRSRGVDFDGQLKLVRGLSFTSGVTYLDSIYTNDVNAPGLEGCDGAPGDCPTVQDLSGRTLDYSPKWHGNVGAQYTTDPFMNGYVLTASVTENFTSSFLTKNNDAPQSRLPGYDTTDFRVALTIPNSRWQVEVFGTNIFDKHYFIDTDTQVLGGPIGVTNPVTGSTLFRGYLGDPQRFGGRVSVSF